MWKNKKVSVIFPTYNEKDSIRAAIEDFLASELVDEIVVVNNNAAQGTDDEVRAARKNGDSSHIFIKSVAYPVINDGNMGTVPIFPALPVVRLVYETRQGYGYAIWKGLEEATGDLLIISEPDGTFSGHDVIKLLAYSDDVPVVVGTRTVRIFVWEGANMGFMLKWGNWAVGKLMEFLFNTTILTDVGCSMRLLSREAYERIAPQFTVGGSAFGPQIMLLTILNHIPFIEIAVNYRKRVGDSSVTGNKVRAVFLGLEMIAMILRYRLLSWLGLFPKNGRPPDK